MNKITIFLVAVVLLAGLLRFWHLGTNPPSLSWDEASWGYNAFSLSLDGRDEFGRFLPWDYLESFGDFKPPLYAYLTIIPVKLFGLNEFSTRFASAFFGTLSIIMTYFLVINLFNEKYKTKVALLAALLLAISPWHIMLSRAAFEANVASFFIISGITLFIIGLKRPWFLVGAAFSFALSLMTFNTARIVTPFLVLILGIKFYPFLWQQRKQSVAAVIVGLVLLFPTIRFLVTPQSRLRYQEVNIFTDSSVVLRSNQEIENDNNVWWSKIIHNRRWEFVREYIRHFGDNLNPSFLFITGDGNPKFSTQDVGQLYLWEAPFLILGLIFLFRFKDKYWWLIPIWLLVGIIPAATARETPHALRIESTLPTWQILVALGLSVKKINRVILILLIGVIFFNFAYFQHTYWRHYKREYAVEWQYEYKQAIEYVKKEENKYQKVWFADTLGRPYIYFLYYLKIPPRVFQQSATINREALGFVNVDAVGKYNFFREKNPPSINTQELYIGNINYLPDGVKIIQNFVLPDGNVRLVAYTK